MLPALPADVVLDEVIVTPRRAYVPLPELRVVERPGWFQLVTPTFKRGGLNEVAFSALDEREADTVIDATIAEYRDLGLKFRWTVGPGSAPADLAERLERRGLTARWTSGMARATAELVGESSDAAASSGPGAADAAMRVDEVDGSTARLFTQVMAEGWAVDPGPFARVHDVLFATPARRHRLYLARVDGEPAAAASYVAFPRSAYLLGAVVLPRFRGRGLYRALVGARLADARARGVALATSHAMDATSAPLLGRMGFETVCRFRAFHN